MNYLSHYNSERKRTYELKSRIEGLKIKLSQKDKEIQRLKNELRLYNGALMVGDVAVVGIESETMTGTFFKNVS